MSTKENQSKTILTISLALNLFVFVAEIYSIGLSATTLGIGLFQYYTEDSNIMALFASLFCAIYAYKGIKDPSVQMPMWVRMLKYMAACCLTVTFLVVIFVLAPTAGPNGYHEMLFSGSMLFHHFLCPIIVVISFLIFEPKPKLRNRHVKLAMVPTIIYAAIILTLNITRVLVGPYPFLHIYEQPIYITLIWFVVIFGGAYLIAAFFRFVVNRGRY